MSASAGIFAAVSVFCRSSAIYCICQMMNQLEVTLIVYVVHAVFK